MNQYNPNIHHRRSIRLKGYDYSQSGLYFITICVQNRACLFGEIVANGQPQNESPRVGQPQIGQPQIGQPQIGQPQIGQPQIGQPQIGQPQIGQPQIGQPWIGQPQIGLPWIGQPQGIAPTVKLNDAGKMVESEWLKLPERFNNIQLHEYVVMPNHFHAILEIMRVGAATRAAPTDEQTNDQLNAQKGKTVGDMMDAFKSITTVEYIRGVKNVGWQPFNGKLWQRNYWEHIIRTEQSYQQISDYIVNNPSKWKDDKFYIV